MRVVSSPIEAESLIRVILFSMHSLLRALLADLSRVASARQLPVGADKVAGVAPGNAIEIILVLRLRLPEVARWGEFRDHLAGPEAGCVHIGNRVFGNLPLLVRDVEDRGTVA